MTNDDLKIKNLKFQNGNFKFTTLTYSSTSKPRIRIFLVRTLAEIFFYHKSYIMNQIFLIV